MRALSSTSPITASRSPSSFDLFVTGIAGRPDNPSLGAETGAAVSSSVFFSKSYKMGVSYYYGSRDIEQRHVAGPFAILGFTPHIFLMAEVDFQNLSINGQTGRQTGAVDDIRFDVEVTQGVHLYLVQEYNLLDFSQSASFSDAYGGGFQWFPRPHLELNALYERQRIGGTGAPFGSVAWVLGHFWL